MIASARRLLAAVAATCACAAVAGCGGQSGAGAIPRPSGAPFTGLEWGVFAQDPQHSAQVAISAQPLVRIHWKTPVDHAPQYTHGTLYIHYGSPLVTQSNTVLVPVKTTPTGGFRIDARTGSSGALVWRANSDYVLPPHVWVPVFEPAITPQGRVYFPGVGGKLYYRDDPDAASGAVHTVVFYGSAAYQSDPSSYDATVDIDTPIASDAQGDVFFGFTVTGANPAGLQSGIARIGADGTNTWVSAKSAAGDGSISQIAMNCAPALSADGSTVYVAASTGAEFGTGYLLALDSTTLATKGRMRLVDPASGQLADVPSDGSATPTVGPDGDVYFGVLEVPLGSHHYRGWLLHFDSALSHAKTPGSFGWDDTASVVPASAVPSYTGGSAYLVMTKYNDYGGSAGGTGRNEIAVLDPDATEPDPILGIPVMKEVLTILGVTPDPQVPGGVKEWCINSAAVDVTDGSVFANSEDGYLYRWDLATNTFPERIQLTGGVGEAYTPTLVGPDGQSYAINDAALYAVGQ